MSNDLLLAIDCGTQSLRALLFDAQGALHAKARVPLTDYQRPQSGWMEMAPEGFWGALVAACQGLWAQTPSARQRLRGVVLTTQRGTVINLDRDGQPLRPAIVWPDERRAAVRGPLPLHWTLAFAALGLADTIRTFREQAEANWIAQHEPQVWQRTHKFVLLSGYLHHRLTGRLADAVGSQVGYLPFDFKRGRWASRFDWKWHCLPLAPHQLPELVQSGSILGSICAAAAADTGLPAGLPVVAGAADKACEVLGAGCVTPQQACLSYGTTATVNLCTPRYVEPVPLVPPYPAALPGHYNTEVQIARGYWLVSWFAEQFAHEEQARAAAEESSPEAFFDDLLAATPPGAAGLMLQPTWSPGVRVPGPEARGAVIGFNETHTRAHLYRAIVEGLAYGLREGLERIERRSGQRVAVLRVAGGGSQSDAAMQITADLFNRPAERPALYEASGLGAAVVGAVALGLHADYPSAVGAMTHVGRRFEPDPRNAALYERLYRRVYLRLYARLRPLYRELRALGAEAPD
ncbi:MAG: FGGY-family carbohydrate kinase [Rubrivivax sp.]|nr:FGGY-family carbohydrate kinase [Rubrivivax sp.]